MSVIGYQSDFNSSVVTPSNNLQIEGKKLEIAPEHISDEVFHTPGRNSYIKTSGNLILNMDIRLRLTAGTGVLPAYPIISLPMPSQSIRASTLPGTIFSANGTAYFYEINFNGLVTIRGEMTRPEEIVLDFKPYLAEFPLRFNPLP